MMVSGQVYRPALSRDVILNGLFAPSPSVRFSGAGVSLPSPSVASSRTLKNIINMLPQQQKGQSKKIPQVKKKQRRGHEKPEAHKKDITNNNSKTNKNINLTIKIQTESWTDCDKGHTISD